MSADAREQKVVNISGVPNPRQKEFSLLVQNIPHTAAHEAAESPGR